VDISLKYALVCVVGIASTLLIWLAKEALKSTVILEFERGFALNYTLVGHGLGEDA